MSITFSTFPLTDVLLLAQIRRVSLNDLGQAFLTHFGELLNFVGYNRYSLCTGRPDRGDRKGISPSQPNSRRYGPPANAMPVILYQDNGQPASDPRHPHTMKPTIIFFFVCCTLALPINAAPNAQPVLPPPDPTTQPSANPAIQVDLQAVP